MEAVIPWSFTMPRCFLPITLAAFTALASATMAEEVNVYSLRQPELVQPLFDAFTKDTGIAVKVAASWMIAISSLALFVSLMPHPGYVPDHME